MEEKYYTEDTDQSSHHYLIPEDKLEEWGKFKEIPEDDERCWDVPEWAERIDGGRLFFTNPIIK